MPEMVIPSLVTFGAKRARRILVGAAPSFPAEKRAVHRAARARVRRLVQEITRDPEAAEEETFQLRRLTGWDVA